MSVNEKGKEITFEELKALDGKKITVHIQNHEDKHVLECLVCFDDPYVYLLHNDSYFDGDKPSDSKGYKYGWWLEDDTTIRTYGIKLISVNETETETEPVQDKTLKPDHYNDHPSGLTCRVFSDYMNFNLGNTFKYLWRAGNKEGESFERDINKAIVYLGFELDKLRKVSDSVSMMTSLSRLSMQYSPKIFDVLPVVNPIIGQVMFLIHCGTKDKNILETCVTLLKQLLECE